MKTTVTFEQEKKGLINKQQKLEQDQNNFLTSQLKFAERNIGSIVFCFQQLILKV